MTENERRKQKAEEIVKRKAGKILKNRKHIMTREIQQVNQATIDSYINSLLTNTDE